MQTHGQADASRTDEGILAAHIVDPRSNTVSDGKRHCVSDDDDGRERRTAHLAVAIDQVVDPETGSTGVGEAEETWVCQRVGLGLSTLSDRDTYPWQTKDQSSGPHGPSRHPRPAERWVSRLWKQQRSTIAVPAP